MKNNKDWTGNTTSIYATHGASNHSHEERAEHDYYATDPAAVKALLDREAFSDCILEPCCGGGHISEVLLDEGYTVYSYDIVQRDYDGQNGTADFLECCPEHANRFDIVTNPPYSMAKEFVEHALDISAYGVKVAMFLKLTFLEGAKRKALFDTYPPKKIYVFRNRIDCWRNGIKPDKPSRAVCYAWFVWKKGYRGAPEIGWID